MNNACPECGAVYAVAEKDIGRRIACKKCSSALIVTEEGLTRDGVEAPRKEDSADRERSRTRDDDDQPRRRDEEDRPERSRKRRERPSDDDGDAEDRPKKPRGPGLGEYLKKVKNIFAVADAATWLYGIGLIVTIYSHYTPLIDEANIAAKQGDIAYAAQVDATDKREVNEKNDGKPSEDDKKAREKREKEYVKKDSRLKEEVAYAIASAQQAKWWNVMYRLAGLIILAFGGILLFVGEQSQFKRILGGVTVLLILMHVVIGGAGLIIQAGGPRG